ncbi:MAG TPA: hypothetical protein VLA93_16970 [Pyrinomonadaceae bacterium]|nr:hypothetical protein [Pyrinomonadaceae bacterium]
MSPQVSIPTLLNLRALLVIAALICLCVSSNVGLQFFPLPAATIQMAPAVQLDQSNKVFYAHQADAKSFRVPMMVQSKKRADKEPPQSDRLIALPSARFGLPTDTRFAIEIDHTVCCLISLTMAPRRGRAPPSLV